MMYVEALFAMRWAWKSENNFMDLVLFAPLYGFWEFHKAAKLQMEAHFPAEPLISPASSLLLVSNSPSQQVFIFLPDTHPIFSFLPLSTKSLHSILSKSESNPGQTLHLVVWSLKSILIGIVSCFTVMVEMTSFSGSVPLQGIM